MARMADHNVRRFLAWLCWTLSLLHVSLASPFCDLGPTAPLSMLDPMLLCVFVSTNPPRKMIFRILVEEYASLILTGSKTLALGGVLPVAGLIGSNSSCFTMDTIYSPLDMPGQASTLAASAEACQARCATIKDCAHFSYFAVDRMCHLQNSSAVAKVIPSGQSGPPNCATGVSQDIHAWVSSSTSSPALPLNCNGDADSNIRGKYVSCPQVYASSSHLAHLLSLVINVRDGFIHSFVWDNGCEACGPQNCMQSALSLDSVNMRPAAEKEESGSCGTTHVHCADPKVSCDLQVLVTWAGTDKDGRHLQSAGRRLSQFGGTTMSSVYETMDYYAT